MKNIYKLISGLAMLAVAVSCDLNKTPVFDDADAFAAFDVTAVTVNEDAGTVSIPVTIASVNPIAATVSYAVEDGSAKAGTNYSLVDESAVLVFDGENRTRNIEININNVDEYTGNLSFTVRIISAGSLKVGAESECTVTIADLNHPLASIIGNYTVVASDYFAGGGDASWTMTFMTDPEDDSVVWIDGLCQGLYGYPSNDYRFYGNATVEEDGSVSSISLPCGQSAASTANGNELSLWIFDGQGGVGNTGNITMTQTSPGVFTINEGYGIGYDAGNNQVSLFGLYYAGAVLTKNE